MIRAIIVDDEVKSCQNLKVLLNDFCPNVEVVAFCESVNESVKAIKTYEPEMVFLDIQLRGESGFDLIEKVQPVNFEIVFVTAHSDYAIRAFKFSAIDYLLKPIDVDDLQNAVERVEKKRNFNSLGRLSQLMANLKPSSSQQYKLAIPSGEGYIFIKISEIIYCEASSNYTTFVMTDGKKYLVTRTLKEYEELLDQEDFFRIHNSYLINLNAIKKYIRGEGGQVIMANDSVLDVSRRKKEFFLKKISH